MVAFNAILKKFGQQGEKTGWTYIDVTVDMAQQLMPGNKRSFRVKGKLDAHKIAGVATIPMGEGAFIIAVNATMRKAIKKRQGEIVKVCLELDKQEVEPSADLIACLKEEPNAYKHFQGLPKSHQNYFTPWIESAKTPNTKAKRIAQAINGLEKGAQFGEVIREIKRQKEALG
ncbi:MAG: hypothetical protein JWP69_1851 [Flaviaesturariibacter sp.]|nr:hypothetical protein [Flaviaesturariibacter sp.]